MADGASSRISRLTRVDHHLTGDWTPSTYPSRRDVLQTMFQNVDSPNPPERRPGVPPSSHLLRSFRSPSPWLSCRCATAPGITSDPRCELGRRHTRGATFSRRNNSPTHLYLEYTTPHTRSLFTDAQVDSSTIMACDSDGRTSIAAVLVTSDTSIRARIDGMLADGGARRPSGLPPVAPFMPMGLLSRIKSAVWAMTDEQRGGHDKQAVLGCVISDVVHGHRLLPRADDRSLSRLPYGRLVSYARARSGRAALRASSFPCPP